MHLQSPWAKPTNGARPTIPLGIKTEIKKEAEHRCPVCRTNAGELAHIDPVSLTFNNHPHNLIYLCPNHHTYYDYGHKYNNVEKQEIKDYKKSLLNFQITQWKLQGNIINSYMSAINIIGRIKEIEVEILKILTPLEFDNFFLKVIDKIDSINKSDQNVSEATNLVTKLGSKTFKSNKDKAYSFFENKSKLLTIIKENNHSINCPLCKGNGYTRYFDTCPPCGGEGILSKEQISNIDFDQYNIENCPLCIGNGCTDHFDTCPPCGGEGKLSKEQISNIDFDQYDIENCPLCNGNGYTDHFDTCPPCGGEGKISTKQISNIDFEHYDIENCPLCKGKGCTGHFDTCPPCGGEGNLSKEQISNIDFDQYDIENCPLCKGKGFTHHFDTCPPCGGEGNLSKEQISNIDFDQYDIENCPLCKGNGSTDYYDTCPACGGEGEISKEQISNIDFNDFIK